MHRSYATPEKARAALRNAGFELHMHSRNYRRANQWASVTEQRNGRAAIEVWDA